MFVCDTDMECGILHWLFLLLCMNPSPCCVRHPQEVTITTDYKTQGNSQLIAMRWVPPLHAQLLQQAQQCLVASVGPLWRLMARQRCVNALECGAIMCCAVHNRDICHVRS
jgi:hypothetical protein